MVKLRLKRMGRKKRPLYAIVATDSRSRRDGRFIEDLGRYNPIPEPAEITLKEERVLAWLHNGAEPTDTVRNILSAKGILLRLHLQRKGKTEEEIEVELTKWKTNREANRNLKVTAKDRKVAAMKAEVEKAAADAIAIAEAKAAAEAAAKAEAAAAAKATEEALAAAQADATEAAAQAQEAANEATVATETAVAEAPTEEVKSDEA